MATILGQLAFRSDFGANSLKSWGPRTTESIPMPDRWMKPLKGFPIWSPWRSPVNLFFGWAKLSHFCPACRPSKMYLSHLLQNRANSWPKLGAQVRSWFFCWKPFARNNEFGLQINWLPRCKINCGTYFSKRSSRDSRSFSVCFKRCQRS